MYNKKLNDRISEEGLVSVIVPVYNVEKYLIECVESILNQSYRALEVILVNDGSHDSSMQICEDFALLDSRIRVIHKDNGGLSTARNAGLDICTGNFICFIDSDDVLHLEFISTLVKSIGDSEVCMCYFKEFLEENTPVDHLVNDVVVERYSGEYVLKNLYNEKFNINVIIACNKLYKRSVWNNLRYPVGRLHEDEFMVHEFLDRVKLFNIINVSLYYYRKRNGSITNRQNESNVRDTIDALLIRRQYYETKGWHSQVKSTKTIERSVFLNQAVSNDFSMWKQYRLLDILNDHISLKMKCLLIMKKVSPRLYRAIARKKGWK